MFQNKHTGALTSLELKSPRYRLLYWVMFLLLFLLAMVCLLPILWVLLSSFKTPKEMLTVPATLFPKSIDLHKLVETWNLLSYTQYYINSLAVAAGTVVFSVVCNGLAGFVLSRLKPRGIHLFFLLIIWTMLLPHTMNLVPLFKNMIHFPIFGFNLSNTFWPMWLVAGASAFNVILFKGFFDGIPMSLIEAARLDGCGNLGVFARVVLPLSRPILAVVSIFAVNGAWGDFLLPYLILRTPSHYTVMVQLYTMKTSLSSPMSLDIQMMALIFAVIPPLIIFLLFQKHIMTGFSLGGIKG